LDNSILKNCLKALADFQLHSEKGQQSKIWFLALAQDIQRS